MNVAETFTDNLKYFEYYVLQTTANKFAKYMLYRSTLKIKILAKGFSLLPEQVVVKQTIGFFAIGQSGAFLSDYLADLKLHSTK